MARASTADVSARAETRGETFALRRVRFALRRPTLGKPDLEIAARWCVPVVLAGFIAILSTASAIFLAEEHARTVDAAKTDLDLLAAVVANDMDLRLQGGAAPAGALAQAIPSRALAHGQKILVADQVGRVVASFPETKTSGYLGDALGGADLLTVLPEQAGVMRIVQPDGSEALATVRPLHEPLGQIAIVHPIEDVLGNWNTMLARVSILLVCVGGVLASLAAAYFWQAGRARRAASSCQTMRDRFDLVLSRGRCGLWDWDLTTGKIDWSLSMFQILGMSPRPQTVAGINALIHPEDGNLDEMVRLLSRGTTKSIDHLFRVRDAAGAWVWLRARAEIVDGAGARPHLVGIAVDVTETMAMEERSANADLRLRDAIETISEAFVVWDADNRLVMCNSKFQRFHELPGEAVAPGTPYATVMAHGTPPIVQSQVPLGAPQPMGARTFEAQLADGRWLQIDERRTKDGGYVSVGTDITALKRNEQQLMDSEHRLLTSVADLRKSRQTLEAQAQQLAELAEKYYEQKAEAEKANRAKSDFLANMGHELRTPLNAILGFSEIMMMESYGELGSPLYQEYCKDIHTSGQYLLNVIADVLEMSRLEAGRVRLEKSDFALKDAVENAVGTIASTAAANAIDIEIDFSDEMRLHADRTAVEKVLTILLNNSVKYTPAEGKVTVRTRAAQGALNIYVEDTGVGITPEAQARLGKPFEQSDKTLKNGMRGSGLGLAIARSLVELHGGTMRFKSKPDVGTMVLVHLPNRRPQTRPNLQVAASSVRATTRPPRFALQPVERSPRKVSRTA